MWNLTDRKRELNGTVVRFSINDMSVILYNSNSYLLYTWYTRVEIETFGKIYNVRLRTRTSYVAPHPVYYNDLRCSFKLTWQKYILYGRRIKSNWIAYYTRLPWLIWKYVELRKYFFCKIICQINKCYRTTEKLEQKLRFIYLICVYFTVSPQLYYEFSNKLEKLA